jgi:hypothetical protein
MKKTFILIFIFCQFQALAQTIDIQGHEKNALFLAYLDNSGNPVKVGSGFLVTIDGIFHLVTAKHVVTTQGANGQLTNNFVDSNLFVFYRSKTGGTTFKKISDIKKQYKVDWLFHPNVNVDIAFIPFDIDTLKDDLKVIFQNNFVDPKRVFATYDTYFVTYQPGLGTLQDLKPLFRKGTIARVEKGIIFMDAFAFPGNSGSPVFLKPSIIRYDNNAINLGGDPLGDQFVGIIGEYIPYQDIAVSAQTNRPRIVFEENTGIAVVYSIDLLNEIIHDPKTEKQIEYVKKNYPNK